MRLLALINADGIVTKETKYGDTSRILTVITKELGKISVLAGNARRNKSGLLTATALFSYSSFTLFKGGSSSLYKLNECELLTSFSALHESLDGMAFASYFCDVTNTVVQEDSPDLAQTRLLLRSLYMLCRDNPDYEKIKAVFEFRTLTIAGLLPNLSSCADCGAVSDLIGLSPKDGCVYCSRCLSKHPEIYKINDSILAAIAYIALAQEKKEFSFNMSDKSIKYLSELGECCIQALLEKNFKTLDYLRRVTALM